MKLFKFFGSVNKEMKLVVWPTFKENKRDTWTVIATSLMYAIFFAVVDWGLIKLLQTFIMGKQIVRASKICYDISNEKKTSTVVRSFFILNFGGNYG